MECNLDALAIRDFYRLLIKRTDLSAGALQLLVAEYAIRVCDTDDDAEDFKSTVYGV